MHSLLRTTLLVGLLYAVPAFAEEGKRLAVPNFFGLHLPAGGTVEGTPTDASITYTYPSIWRDEAMEHLQAAWGGDWKVGEKVEQPNGTLRLTITDGTHRVQVTVRSTAQKTLVTLSR